MASLCFIYLCDIIRRCGIIFFYFKLKYIQQLHPYLGTPTNKELLEKLSTDEQKRTDEYLQLAKDLHRIRRAVVVKHGRRAFSQLGGLTDGLFIRFDRLTCEYDIEELRKESFFLHHVFYCVSNSKLFGSFCFTLMNNIQRFTVVPSRLFTEIPFFQSVHANAAWFIYHLIKSDHVFITHFVISLG